MEENIKQLPLEFIGRGEVKKFKFTQIKKNEFGFIYKVESEDSSSHYEVFENKISNCYDFINKTITGELMETYPSAKFFGKWAWTANTLEKAYEILNEIETKQSGVSEIIKSKKQPEIQTGEKRKRGRPKKLKI
jgi:hypothetical protein